MSNHRDQAILWARQMMEQDFVVLDTETTGLESNAEACSIAIVAKDNTILLNSLVRPCAPIPSAASRIHSITDAQVKDAPTILDLEEQLIAALQGRPVVVYNAEFDARILRQSLLFRGAELAVRAGGNGTPYKLPEDHFCHRHNFKPECAMEAFAAFYGDWNDYKGSYTWKRLTVAAAHFGINTQGAHGALADCLMTLGVVKGMAASKLSTEER